MSYTQVMHVKACEHTKNANGSEVWNVFLEDKRPKKAGGLYCALSVIAEFWGSTKPCEEGEILMFQGDLRNHYWQDKDGNDRATLKLFNPRVIDYIKGKDVTPKKKEQKEIEI